MVRASGDNLAGLRLFFAALSTSTSVTVCLQFTTVSKTSKVSAFGGVAKILYFDGSLWVNSLLSNAMLKDFEEEGKVVAEEQRCVGSVSFYL